MANVGDLTVKLKADAKDLEEGLDAAQSKLKSTSDGMKSVGKKMTMGLTGPIAGIGVGAIMTGANFEKGMNRVKALTGTTGADFDALTQQAKDLGSSTAFSATQASEAMGFLAMAGFKSSDIVGAMPGVLNLAAAAQMDLGEAADITSNIMTGFGKDVDELGTVNDVLVKAMTTANVDLTQLGEAMKYVGPVAASAGMDFENTAAAIALLGNAGIQGSMAGTSLRGAMTKLLKPSEDAAATMAKLGIDVLDSEGNLKSFTDIVAELETAGITTGDAMTIFGQRAGPAMMALVSQGSGALGEMTESLKDSGGTAESIASVQMQGMSGAVTEMKSAFEGLMISISEDLLPVLTSLVDFITPVLQKFSSMPGPVKLIIVVFGALVAILGPLLILIGMMLPGIAAFGPALTFMTSGMVISTVATYAQATAMAVLNVAMGPIGLIILGIVAAIVAVVLVIKNWEKIVELFRKAWAAFWPKLKIVMQPVIDFITGAIEGVQQVWDDVWAAIKILAIVAWEKISQTFTDKFGWMLPGGAVFNALTKVQEKFGEIWGTVKTKFESVGKLIKGVWDDYFGWLRPEGAIFTALTKLKDTWVDTWKAIGGALKGPVNLAIKGMNKIVDLMNAFEFGWDAKKVRGVTVIPGFTFKPFNLAHIPEMAEGGIVKKPTLAMIGEAGPEAVTPLGRAGAIGGTTVVVNISGPTYGFDDFEKKVSQAIRDGVRRGGFQGILSPARG